jgi:hypothetical protein
VRFDNSASGGLTLIGCGERSAGQLEGRFSGTIMDTPTVCSMIFLLCLISFLGKLSPVKTEFSLTLYSIKD